MATMRLGILGGTFDPVHFGHLAVARTVQRKLALDELWLIPAAQPPHKPDLKIAPFAHRLAMLEIAVADRPGLVVSALEADLPKPSYTIDTLRQLRRRLGANPHLFFIIGLDAFREITTWKRYRALPEVADLVVISRPPDDPGVIHEIILAGFPGFCRESVDRWCPAGGLGQGGIRAVDMTPVAISSSQVRRRVRGGESVTDLVPAGVAEYLRAKALYEPG